MAQAKSLVHGNLSLCGLTTRASSADWRRMWSYRFRLIAALAAIAIGATACGGAEPIDRTSAIIALETTGATTAEATCIADTLVLLDELDAADPRIERGDVERDALVNARNRCIIPEAEIEVAGQQVEAASESGFTVERPIEQGSEFEAVESELDAALEAAGPLSELRTEAIANLVRLGRSLDNATCVVDHIISAEADHVVLVADTFGLGLEPIEASAFVACSGIS